jgi:hypothetical protein
MILALGRRALSATCAALVGGALLWRTVLLVAGVAPDVILLLTPVTSTRSRSACS